MAEDEILQSFLEKASKSALEEIKNEGKLSEKNAIPLILKTQFNHIAHLDSELSELRKIVGTKLVTNDEFKNFREVEFSELRKIVGTRLVTKDEFKSFREVEFKGLKDEFKSFKTEMRWLFGIVLAFISSLMAVLVF